MVMGVVEITAKKGMREELVGVLGKCAVKSKAEPGCICYDLYVSAEDDVSICLLERWKDREALSEHSQTEHFKELMETSGNLKEGDDKVQFFDI